MALIEKTLQKGFLIRTINNKNRICFTLQKLFKLYNLFFNQIFKNKGFIEIQLFYLNKEDTHN